MLFWEWHQIYTILPWIALAVAAFVLLFFVNAPYGRFSQKNTGLTLNGRWAWVLMESPAPLIMAGFFLFTDQPINLTQIILLLLWESHYLHRTYIYPFTWRNSSRLFPAVIVVSGILFNVVNAYINGNSLFTHAGQYSAAWLGDIRFITGTVLFISGYIINRHADYVLYRLKTENPAGYRVPYGGFFRWVSCPNYLGEIIIWLGWALATWSLAGVAFAVWTIANLAPRAVAHHRWYRSQFTEYPARRRALVPGIW